MLESHACTFVLDPMEPEPEEQHELAPVEDVNHIPWALLIFVFYLWFMNVH
jgi:hypothetical protein